MQGAPQYIEPKYLAFCHTVVVGGEKELFHSTSSPLHRSAKYLVFCLKEQNESGKRGGMI